MRMIAQLHRQHMDQERVREFAQMCRFLAWGRGKSDSVLHAQQGRATERTINAIKAAAGSTISDSGQWGSQLTELSEAFVASLGHAGVFDRAVGSMINVPMQTRLSIVTGRAVGEAVGEGQIKPASQLELDTNELRPSKVCSLVCLTSEAMKLASSAALALLETQLRSATAHATDKAFLDLLLASVSPTASSGDVIADLALLAETITTNSDSRLFVIAHSTIVKRLSLRSTSTGALAFPNLTTQGGSIAGIEVMPSDEIDADVVAMFDATAIAANPGVALPSASKEALLDMGGAQILSLWQRNLAAVLIHRTYAAEVIRADGVAAINSASYIQSGS